MIKTFETFNKNIKKVVITIAEKYVNDLDNIIDKLEKDGLTVDVTYEFGIIIGFLEKDKIEKFKEYKEIIAITEESYATISK